MPFFVGRKSREGQKRLVDAFLVLRDQAKEWSQKGHAVKLNYRSLCDALSDSRKAAGRPLSPYVFSTGARLINYVLTRHCKSIKGDELDDASLSLLKSLEGRDAVLIARGLDYDRRKADLLSFPSKLLEVT